MPDPHAGVARHALAAGMPRKNHGDATIGPSPSIAAPSPAMTAWRARISASTAPPKKTRHAMAAYLRGAAGAGAAAPGPPVRMVLKKVLLGSSTITSLLLLKLR